MCSEWCNGSDARACSHSGSFCSGKTLALSEPRAGQDHRFLVHGLMHEQRVLVNCSRFQQENNFFL